MELRIVGTPNEIADLVVALQDRHEKTHLITTEIDGIATGVEAAFKDALGKGKQLDPSPPVVHIVADGAFAKIFINGRQLKGVRGYTLAHNRNGVSILDVELVCGSVVSDISDVLIMYAPTSEQHGRKQDEEDYGRIKDVEPHSDKSGTSEQASSNSESNRGT